MDKPGGETALVTGAGAAVIAPADGAAVPASATAPSVAFFNPAAVAQGRSAVHNVVPTALATPAVAAAVSPQRSSVIDATASTPEARMTMGLSSSFVVPSEGDGVGSGDVQASAVDTVSATRPAEGSMSAEQAHSTGSSEGTAGDDDEEEGDWASAIDESSGRVYYYNVLTNETSWTLPEGYDDFDDSEEDA